MIEIGLAIHSIAAVFWVGGMAFAYLILRPYAVQMDGPDRLRLWHGVFGRFFPLVWVSVVALLLSGYWMIWAMGGFASVGLHIHLMHGTGLIMMLLFGHLFFAPWRRMKAALSSQDLPTAAKQLGQIRKIVLVNLCIGVVTVLIGVTGRYWG